MGVGLERVYRQKCVEHRAALLGRGIRRKWAGLGKSSDVDSPCVGGMACVTSPPLRMDSPEDYSATAQTDLRKAQGMTSGRGLSSRQPSAFRLCRIHFSLGKGPSSLMVSQESEGDGKGEVRIQL